MATIPNARGTAVVTTAGEAFAIPTGTAAPYYPANSVAVYVSALAFVGFGNEASPPAPTTANTGYQEAETVIPYTMTPLSRDLYVYVYAVTGTLTTRVTMYG